MIDPDAQVRAEILARLAGSRAELQKIFEPPPQEAAAAHSASNDTFSDFPRSRTMKMLLSGRGLGTLGTLAVGLLVARPALALRLLRMLPASTVARMVLTRFMAMAREKQQ